MNVSVNLLPISRYNIYLSHPHRSHPPGLLLSLPPFVVHVSRPTPFPAPSFPLVFSIHAILSNLYAFCYFPSTSRAVLSHLTSIHYNEAFSPIQVTCLQYSAVAASTPFSLPPSILCSPTFLFSIVFSSSNSSPLPREAQQVCLLLPVLSGWRPDHMLTKLDGKLITQGLGETTPAPHTPLPSPKRWTVIPLGLQTVERHLVAHL